MIDLHHQVSTGRSRSLRAFVGGTGLWLCLGLLLACGETRPVDGQENLIISSDSVLAAAAAEMLPLISEKSGLELLRPVVVESRSRAQLEAYLLATLEQDFPPERANDISASYGLLGLVPADFDMTATMIDVLLEQVAGFYEPDSTALFLLDDLPEALLGPTLAHELVHALQDQHTDLSELMLVGEHPNDRLMAAQAAIEGHATLVMSEYQFPGMSTEQIAEIYENMDPLLEVMLAQSPALSRVPPVLQQGLILPYFGGLRYVAKLWEAHPGRPAPFGEFLPLSTEQVAELQDPSANPDPPVSVTIESSGNSAAVYSDNLGATETRILFESLNESLGLSSPGEIARDWGGDRYSLFRTADGEESLIWVSTWDTPASRDLALGVLRSGSAIFPAPSVIESETIDGLPAVTVRIGSPPDVTIRAGVGG